MKKSIKLGLAVLGVSLATSYTASAQSVNIGGGYTFSKTNFYEEMNRYQFEYTSESSTHTEEQTLLPRHGFNLRLTYEFKLGDKVGLETGFKYSTRGFTFRYSYESSYNNQTYKDLEEYKYKLNYLDIPIIVNFQLFQKTNFKMYGRTGLYAGYAIGGEISTKYEEEYQGERYEVNYTYGLGEEMDAENRFGGGFIAGVGAQFNNFFGEVNYSVGTESFADMGDVWRMNHDLGITIGYKLNTKK